MERDELVFSLLIAFTVMLIVGVLFFIYYSIMYFLN